VNKVQEIAAVNLGVCAGIFALWIEFFVAGINDGFIDRSIPLEPARYLPIALLLTIGVIFTALNSKTFACRYGDFLVGTIGGRYFLAGSFIFALIWSSYSAAFLGRHNYSCVFNCGYKWHLDDWVRWLSVAELPQIFLIICLAASPVLTRAKIWLNEGR